MNAARAIWYCARVCSTFSAAVRTERGCSVQALRNAIAGIAYRRISKSLSRRLSVRFSVQHEQIKHRNHKDGDKARAEHAADHAAPDRMPAGCTRASRNRERQHAKREAIDVIRIGRSRRRAANSAASNAVLPCACKSFANSTIRMAFFADRPTVVSNAT